MSNIHNSINLFAKAEELIPGGVNSPVRAFGAVGSNPLFIQRADGASVWDVDGNAYIDYVASWGPIILGHNNPGVRNAVRRVLENGLSFGAPCSLEVDIADIVTRLTGIEMVRMVNSGTEAVMSALRLARGFTRRDKLIKFAGCYHGHCDSMLVAAGSGALTAGVPDSAGVPAASAANTLTAIYNDLDSVSKIFSANKGQVAALIVEPVAANMGVVPPSDGFLDGLRRLCDEHGALLIFDEVITGFRLALGGAQAYFGVEADLVTYGKIIGGGLPVGAYGGRRDVMEHVAPCGPVYQAGTLSGNPVAMAAGLCQLQQLEQDAAALYPRLEKLSANLATGLRAAARMAGIPIHVNQVGSLCCAYFTGQAVGNYQAAKTADTDQFAAFFRGMLDRGIYLGPSQFEAMFVGACHTAEMINQTIEAAADTFAALGN